MGTQLVLSGRLRLTLGSERSQLQVETEPRNAKATSTADFLSLCRFLASPPPSFSHGKV